jgi:hypothetical protein
MIQTKATEIAALLAKAGAAHHQYEQTVLKGVYDQDWPTWYADYVIRHGLGELLNQAVTVEQISQFFCHRNEDHKREHPLQNWADYTAKKMIEDFSDLKDSFGTKLSATPLMQ